MAFRAIVSTEGRFRVCSRRGRDMTGLVPELAALPVFATLDGELCAFGPGGTPDFPLICERMLHGRSGIAVTYLVFDLRFVDGYTVMMNPIRPRQARMASSTPYHSTGRGCLLPAGASFTSGSPVASNVSRRFLGPSRR